MGLWPCRTYTYTYRWVPVRRERVLVIQSQGDDYSKKHAYILCMCTLQEGPSFSDKQNTLVLQTDEEGISEMGLVTTLFMV